MSKIKGNNNLIINKPIIQLYEAPTWCRHCIEFAPIWKKMQELKTTGDDGKEIKANELITFESYDDKHEKTKEEGISGFPTIKFIINTKTYQYDGKRTPEALLKFIVDTLNA